MFESLEELNWGYIWKLYEAYCLRREAGTVLAQHEFEESQKIQWRTHPPIHPVDKGGE